MRVITCDLVASVVGTVCADAHEGVLLLDSVTIRIFFHLDGSSVLLLPSWPAVLPGASFPRLLSVATRSVTEPIRFGYKFRPWPGAPIFQKYAGITALLWCGEDYYHAHASFVSVSYLFLYLLNLMAKAWKGETEGEKKRWFLVAGRAWTAGLLGIKKKKKSLHDIQL